MNKSSLAALAALAALTACPSEEPKKVDAPPKKIEKPMEAVKPTEPEKPPEPPKVPVPESALKMKELLDVSPHKVQEAISLPGRTMPGCKESWRARLYLSEKRGNVGEFVNINKYATEAEATACFEEYKSSVMNAGQAAWDRLSPLISTNKTYLYQFSEAMTDAARRDAVVAELKKVE